MLSRVRGGVIPLIVYCDNSYAVGTSPQLTGRGGLGACSPRKLDSLRTFLRHSDSYLGADLASSKFDMQNTSKLLSIAYPVCIIWKAAL